MDQKHPIVLGFLPNSLSELPQCGAAAGLGHTSATNRLVQALFLLGRKFDSALVERAKRDAFLEQDLEQLVQQRLNLLGRCLFHGR